MSAKIYILLRFLFEDLTLAYTRVHVMCVLLATILTGTKRNTQKHMQNINAKKNTSLVKKITKKHPDTCKPKPVFLLISGFFCWLVFCSSFIQLQIFFKF